jgi:Domain of unknown function (DUF4389)
MDEPQATPTAAGYPVHVEIQHQERYSRFMPLVKWLLLLPHYIVLTILGFVAFFAIVAAWFAVLFTGRYPRGIFDFLVGVQRWGMRVYAYLYLMVDGYPPFSLADDPNYPVHLEIEYPEEGVARWRPLVAWILAIPYLIVAGIIHYIAYVLVFFAFFTILFARVFPRGMFDIVLVALRWQSRGYAYALWMVTRYPPFVWD